MANTISKAGAKAPVAKVKNAKATEVKTAEQLNEDLIALLAENLESRRSHQLGELVNPHVLTVQRKNIARLHTAIAAAKREQAESSIKENK